MTTYNLKWPWEDNPNWAAPREGATSDTSDKENWAFECEQCALRFPTDIKMKVVGDHWHTQHDPDGDPEDPKPKLNLVWIGLGPPPEAPSEL